VEKTKECRGGEQRAENERVREVTGVRATYFTNWGQVENAGKSLRRITKAKAGRP